MNILDKLLKEAIMWLCAGLIVIGTGVICLWVVLPFCILGALFGED